MYQIRFDGKRTSHETPEEVLKELRISHVGKSISVQKTNERGVTSVKFVDVPQDQNLPLTDTYSKESIDNFN
jgi:hypothetical protein